MKKRISFGGRSLAAISATVIAAGAAVLCWSPLPAEAATTTGSATPPAAPYSLSISVAPSSGGAGALSLNSQVQGGPSLAGKLVSFFVVTKEFGTNMDVPIGTATTASDGTASVSYKPTWSGSQEFVATLQGTGSSSKAVQATTTYTVAASNPGPLYATANHARPLASVGHVFVTAALSLVALVWLTLITFLLIAKLRLPRLAGGGQAD